MCAAGAGKRHAVFRSRWFILAAFACALSSCLDVREEIWITAGGGGRAELHYVFPADALRLAGGEEGIRRELAKTAAAYPELHAVTHTLRPIGDRMELLVSAELEKIWRWEDVVSENEDPISPAAKSIGKISLRRSLRTVDFKRVINWSAILPGSAFLPANRWQGHSTTTILHLPSVGIRHNATRTEDSGRTLIWETPMAAAVAKPLSQSFQTTLPASFAARVIADRHLIPILITAAALAALFVWHMKSRRRARRG